VDPKERLKVRQALQHPWITVSEVFYFNKNEFHLFFFKENILI
jgi:hypothetical protein